MPQSLVSSQLCHARHVARPNISPLTATRMSNPFQSFQCGKGSGHPQLRSPAALGIGRETTTDSRKSSNVSPSSREGMADCNSSVSNKPDLTSPTASVHAVAESSILLSGTPQPSSTKRKKHSKVNELPSLQDAPGLPERLGDQPLRLIIVGHNPSDHAWRSGHYYSNPSNWMWRILVATHIAPPHVTGPQHDGCMAADAGVGFTDVGSGIPGTQSSQFDSATFQSWGSGFYSRLAAHVARACDSLGQSGSASTGPIQIKVEELLDQCKCGRCGAPPLVAFSGKRQWSELINTGRKGSKKIAKFDVGPQSMRPEGWPLPACTAVWVMTSTSGASPMTTEARMAPWYELSNCLAQITWPRQAICPLAENADSTIV